MKQFKKAFILIFTCSVPILFFFYLKLFTKNHYEIPVIIQTLDSNQACDDAVLFFEKENGETQKLFNTDSLVKIVVLMDGFPADKSKSIAQVDRVLDQMKIHDNFKVFVLAKGEKIPTYRNSLYLNSDFKDLHFLTSDSLRNTAFIHCKAYLKDFNTETNVYLFDNENKLRGRYNGTDEVDMDRLSTELSILYY